MHILSIAEFGERLMIFLSEEPKIEGLTACDWKEQGISLFHLGRYDDALKAFDRTIELDPKNSDAWGCKGSVLHLVGRTSEAIKAYDRAIELNPNDSELWTYKGVILKNFGRTDEALRAFDRAIELDPKNSRAWEGKGMALDYMGRTDDALKSFDRAIELNPKNSGLWLNRGDTLSHMCRKDNAIVAYKRAIELDPKNSRAIDALKNLVNIKPNQVFSRHLDKNKDSTNNEFMSTNRRAELKKDSVRDKGNAKEYFIMILVCAIICALITQYYMRSWEVSIFIFFMVFVTLIFAQISSTCSNCGNVNGISLDSRKLVDTKQSQKHFTKQEIVATSVRKIVATSDRKDRDANVIDIIKHYEGVNYLKTTTINTYEKIYVCKYCGATSNKQYQTKSSKITRL